MRLHNIFRFWNVFTLLTRFTVHVPLNENSRFLIFGIFDICDIRLMHPGNGACTIM